MIQLKIRLYADILQDPSYILIKRWVPEYEQDFLWNHTLELPELRALQQQGKRYNNKDDEFEIVRKHKRKTSPSPLVKQQGARYNSKDDEFEIVRKHKRKTSPSTLDEIFAAGHQ
jgi:hypothetical protein